MIIQLFFNTDGEIHVVHQDQHHHNAAHRDGEEKLSQGHHHIDAAQLAHPTPADQWKAIHPNNGEAHQGRQTRKQSVNASRRHVDQVRAHGREQQAQHRDTHQTLKKLQLWGGLDQNVQPLRREIGTMILNSRRQNR